MKKIIIIGGIILFLFVAIIVGTFVFYLGSIEADDVQLADDSELLADTQPISTESNTWIDLKKAESDMYYPTDKEQVIIQLLKGETSNEKLVQEIVEKNQKTYGHINNVLLEGKLENPSMIEISKSTELDPENLKFESEIYLRKLNRLLLLAVLNDLIHSNFSDGIKSLRREMDFVNLVQNNRNLITAPHWLNGISLRRNSIVVIEIIAGRLGLKKNKAIILQHGFENFKNNDNNGLYSLAKGEYLITNKILNSDSYRKQILKKVLFSSNNNLKAPVDLTDEDIELMSKKRLNVFFAKNVALNKQIPIFKKLYSDPTCKSLSLGIKEDENNLSDDDIMNDQQIADVESRLKLTMLEEIKREYCVEYFVNNSMQVLLANSAYKMDHDTYAASLGELKKGGYLAVKIIDEIGGEKLIYNQQLGHFDMPQVLAKILQNKPDKQDK